MILSHIVIGIACLQYIIVFIKYCKIVEIHWHTSTLAHCIVALCHCGAVTLCTRGTLPPWHTGTLALSTLAL